MVFSKRILLGLAAALLCGVAAVGADEAEHDRVRELVESGAIRPLEEVVDTVTARYPGRLLEVELEREEGRLVYEIELVTEDGEYIEVLVDAETGEVLGREHD